MDNESIYNKIREVFGNLPDNYNVLEEQIDINLQMEYFDYSRKIKKDMKESQEVIENHELLFSPDNTYEDVKKLLVKFASVEDIEAYRAIEKFVNTSNKGVMRDWAILALQESRMLLQSRLLDENQVFISTGLGGKGAKLRYFVVLVLKEQAEFTDTQKNVVEKEFNFILKNNDIEIEEVQFVHNFATIMTVIPIEISIKDIFKEAIAECNHYGDFLRSNFIVTNVKRLSLEEIKNFLDKHLDELDEEGDEDADDASTTDFEM